MPTQIEKDLEKQMEQYSIVTFADILRALKSHPDWLEELRKIILTTELLELPKKFDELLKRVEKIESDVEILKQDVAVLKQDVAVLKQDVAVLKQDVAVLKQDVAVLKQDVAVLKQDVAVLKQDVAVLKQDVAVLKQDVAVLKQDVAVLKQDVEILKKDMAYLKGEFGRFKGKDFERTIKDKHYAYFGKLLRKTKLVQFEEILQIIDDAEEKGLIKEEQRDSLLNLDIIVKGQIKSTQKPVVLAVEISYSLYEDDIERAIERAQILAQILHEEVIPTVVTAEVREDVEKLADNKGIFLIKVDY
jgi:chromosome segregation ATPase